MSLFPGISDDVYDCHLYPAVGASMRVNRDLDAHYRANIGRSAWVCQESMIHPLLALTPITRTVVCNIADNIAGNIDHIDQLILYAINLRDIELLHAIANTRGFNTYSLYVDAVFTALPGGNDVVTKWVIYHYLRRIEDLKLESGPLMRTRSYDAIAASDFAKLVIHFLNMPKIIELRYTDYQYTNGKFLKYIFKLIDTNDRYLITILSGLRNDYYGAYYDVVYYAARANRRDVVISLIVSQRYHMIQEVIAMLIDWKYYRPFLRLTTPGIYDVADIAILMGRAGAIDWINTNRAGEMSDYTCNDALLPVVYRVAKVRAAIKRRGGHMNAFRVVAIYLDNPDIYDPDLAWLVGDSTMRFMNLHGAMSRCVYETGKASALFRLAYQAANNIPRDNLFATPIFGWNSVITYVISTLKYYNGLSNITDLITYLAQFNAPSYNLATVTRLIVKRAIAQLYDSVDPSYLAYALIYAYRYGNIEACRYFREKIRNYDGDRGSLFTPIIGKH